MSSPTHGQLAGRLEGMNLYLVGMMGAGKSAAGRPLADALGYRFVDVDTALEQVAGQSIEEIFNHEGEAAFRALETAVLAQITGWHSLVVATGGGAVTRPENWGHLRQGLVVWLDAEPALLLQRLNADPTPRPLLRSEDRDARLQALLEQRRPLYAQADLRVNPCGGSPEQVAADVLRAIPSVLRERQKAPTQPTCLQDRNGMITASLN
ncbi:MAG: shikimate kinase [Cyanobacteriota bacterium]|nr:shikimate kinase [Cyanobacteriota bacterium]